MAINKAINRRQRGKTAHTNKNPKGMYANTLATTSNKGINRGKGAEIQAAPLTPF